MYTLDFATQVSRICMDEIRRRGKEQSKQKSNVYQLFTQHNLLHKFSLYYRIERA